MGIVVVGLSHQTAPVELREGLAISKAQMAPALKALLELNDVREAVILSTCNRVEIYARPENTRPETIKALKGYFACWYEHKDVQQSLYVHEGEKAVQHLFRVASGLDSMVIGESEIIGQVKSAYLSAKEVGTTGKITNVLFQRALFVGKNVRTRTGISEGASSVGSAAVKLAETIFGGLSGNRILLIGAGKMARLTIQHLLSQKVGEIVVLNRTLSKAEEMAQQFNGRAGPMDDLEKEIRLADIVISSVQNDKPIITFPQIESIMPERQNRSLYFVDIGVPRNVDPTVNDIMNAYVYDIDDLKAVVDENLNRRRQDLSDAEEMVSAASAEFYQWVSSVLEGKQMGLRHHASELEA